MVMMMMVMIGGQRLVGGVERRVVLVCRYGGNGRGGGIVGMSIRIRSISSRNGNGPEYEWRGIRRGRRRRWR